MSKRNICLIIICLISFFITPAFGLNGVDTVRDDKGVWFISGPPEAGLYDVFEEMGYAVATDRLWQMELYRRQARGTLAAVFGPDQLETDVFMRIIGYSDAELTAGFNSLGGEARDIINGYVAGINRRIAEIGANPALVPFEFFAVGIMPTPWTCQDVLAWTATMQRFFDPEALDMTQMENAELLLRLQSQFGVLSALRMFNDLRWTNDPAAPTYIDYESAGETASVQAEPTGSPVGKQMSRARFDAMIERSKRIVERLKKINAHIKMGSYAWVVAGRHTVSGKPIVYSGPQMGFSVPSITAEGSIRAGGLDISGMNVPGLPGIIIGRTPHHAWSMQVGHAHTTDYYIENPSDVTLHRLETIQVRGADPVLLPVFRSDHGPIVNPIPYDPGTYSPTLENPLVAWKYAHWNYEFKTIEAFLDLARAKSILQFHQGIRKVAVSQHFCYADKHGNIGYWMSGRDPLRLPGEWRLPQGLFFGIQLEWNARFVRPLSSDLNTPRGWYAGWNNKTGAFYPSGFNAVYATYGPFHRTHVIYDYFDETLAGGGKVSFEAVRDLALYIAATDSFHGGGNPWAFVSDDFTDAVMNNATPERQAALDILSGWDGHFVDGGPTQWAFGADRADAWILMDKWIREVVRLIFLDELGMPEDGEIVLKESNSLLFNVLLHGLHPGAGITNRYNWFRNLTDPAAPQTPEAIIVTALDNVLGILGPRPWGIGARGTINFRHDMLGVVHTMPFSSRSTYGHCVEYGSMGPVRIQSMFPLGESGNILMGPGYAPVFDSHFFSMTPVYDGFAHREFPLFE
ncbi:MAG: penicillin acylase family protein [Thermodesulfobacteriota bacterium]